LIWPRMKPPAKMQAATINLSIPITNPPYDVLSRPFCHGLHDYCFDAIQALETYRFLTVRVHSC
jgi:hypothetical protein